MKRVGPAAIAVLLASLIGCYSNAIEPSPPPDPSASIRVTAERTPAPSPTFEPVGTLVTPIAAPDELLYYCQTIAFPPSALARPGADELVNHPAAAALREFLVSEYATTSLFPAHGWHFLGESLEVAEFGQLIGHPIEPSGSALMVSFDRRPQYTLASWGDCLPRLVPPPGFVALEWWLPDLAAPDRAATRIAVDVVTTTCNAGPDVELIQPPHIQRDATSINIAMIAQRVDGPTGCQRFECDRMAPTRLDVVLPEAVGTRGLYDGFTFPPRDATVAVELSSCAGG